MIRLVNYLHLALNSYILLSLLIKIILYYQFSNIAQTLKKSFDLETEIQILWIAQVAQVTDLFATRGNILAVLLQFIGRSFLSTFFLTPQTKMLSVFLTAIPWSIADIVRYSFYLFRNSYLTFLRYNLFIVLYPIGVFYGELNVLKDYQENFQVNKTAKIYYTLSEINTYGLYIGIPILYIYMLQARKKQYNKIAFNSRPEHPNKTLNLQESKKE